MKERPKSEIRNCLALHILFVQADSLYYDFSMKFIFFSKTCRTVLKYDTVMIEVIIIETIILLVLLSFLIYSYYYR